MSSWALVAPAPKSAFKGYAVDAVTRQIGAGGVSVRYQLASTAGASAAATVSSPAMSLDLMPLLKGSIVPGSLRFRIGAYTYVDRAGVLYHSIDPATGAGTPAGTVNYATGSLSITSWPAGAFSFVLEAGLVNPGTPGMSFVVGRTAARPLKSQSFTLSAVALDGTQVSAVAGADGGLEVALASGQVDVETGIFRVAFGAMIDGVWVSKLVDPASLRYNTVSYSYLPLDADQIGIDPVRLPTDGRVPIFRPGNLGVMQHTARRTLTVSNGQTVNLGRTRLSRVRVLGDDDALISTGYSTDLDAGTITFSAVAGYSQPITIEDSIEDMARISDVQISGRVTLLRPLSHAYPAGSHLASALVLGDLYAYVKNVFDQQTWTSVWSDTLIGNPASGTYDITAHPIVVTNAGAVTERWAILFTSTTSFQVIGEHLGIIAIGNTSAVCAPINAAAGVPFLTLDPAGWGLGWAAGSVLRFKTMGAIAPVWAARAIQQGAETMTDDGVTLLGRGDVDA
jgi:hypothetical protein